MSSFEEPAGSGTGARANVAERPDAGVQPARAPRWRATAVPVVALFVVAGVLLYYGRLSEAGRAVEKVPQDATQSDVVRLVGGKERASSDVGDIRIVHYSFPDYSVLACTFVGIEESRTRKVPKVVDVTKTRRVMRQVGWSYLGYPEYDWVEEPYVTTELEWVSEQYEVTIWRARSAKAGFDNQRVKRDLGL